MPTGKHIPAMSLNVCTDTFVSDSPVRVQLSQKHAHRPFRTDTPVQHCLRIFRAACLFQEGSRHGRATISARMMAAREGDEAVPAPRHSIHSARVFGELPLYHTVGDQVQVVVHLLDSSSRSVLAKGSDVIEEITLAIALRLGFQDPVQVSWYAGLHECFDGVTLQRPLPKKRTIASVLTKWPRGGSTSDESPKLVFAFAAITEQLQKSPDPKVLQFLYMQAVFHVNCGLYPVSVEESILLAALQLQARFGEYDASRHKPGYFTSMLVGLISGGIIGERRPHEWEGDILRRFATLSDDARTNPQKAFLARLRHKDYYGCTFFVVRQRFARALPNRLQLAISAGGLYFFDLDSRSSLERYSLNSLFRWGCRTPKAFMFQTKDAAGDQGVAMEFHTRDGAAICDLLALYAELDLVELGFRPWEPDKELPPLPATTGVSGGAKGEAVGAPGSGAGSAAPSRPVSVVRKMELDRRLSGLGAMPSRGAAPADAMSSLAAYRTAQSAVDVRHATTGSRRFAPGALTALLAAAHAGNGSAGSAAPVAGSRKGAGVTAGGAGVSPAQAESTSCTPHHLLQKQRAAAAAASSAGRVGGPPAKSAAHTSDRRSVGHEFTNPAWRHSPDGAGGSGRPRSGLSLQLARGTTAGRAALRAVLRNSIDLRRGSSRDLAARLSSVSQATSTPQTPGRDSVRTRPGSLASSVSSPVGAVCCEPDGGGRSRSGSRAGSVGVSLDCLVPPPGWNAGMSILPKPPPPRKSGPATSAAVVAIADPGEPTSGDAMSPAAFRPPLPAGPSPVSGQFRPPLPPGTPPPRRGGSAISSSAPRSSGVAAPDLSSPEALASCRVQAAFRGFRLRALLLRHYAATRIQASWRGYRARCAFDGLLLELEDGLQLQLKDAAAVADVRGVTEASAYGGDAVAGVNNARRLGRASAVSAARRASLLHRPADVSSATSGVRQR